jgi:adenosylmethionine-8-amino-7-oxononanoate aminotransferase
MCLSKALTGGTIPMAMTFTQELFDAFMMMINKGIISRAYFTNLRVARQH